MTLGCGAAGRIEKLASVELVGPPARAAGAVARSGAVRSPAAAAAAASPDTGHRSQDGDDSVLRAQDGQAVAAVDSSGPQAAPATITGELTYPGEWLPKDLKVCADEVVSKKRICTSRQQKHGKSIRYELKVPAGTYLVIAEIHGSDVRLGQMDLIIDLVIAGQQTREIGIRDLQLADRLSRSREFIGESMRCIGHSCILSGGIFRSRCYGLETAPDLIQRNRPRLAVASPPEIGDRSPSRQRHRLPSSTRP